VKPGDRVEAVGIYKAMGVRVNPQQRVLKNVYRTYIDVINFVRSDKRRFNVNVDEEKQGDEQPMEVDEAGVQD
jgi:DNA replication licensing factor MCM4